MTRSLRLLALILALAFLAFHLPFLPQSLEDLDSINFALGVRDFDVAKHQPHPPGYPLFILAAKGVNLVVPSETHALAVLSILSGAFGFLALLALYRALDDEAAARHDFSNLVAALLVVTSPLYWVTAARPLSDLFGLAAVLAVQVLILRARTLRALVVAAFCAALVAGIRSQAVWLTAPLLVYAYGQQVFLRQSKEQGAVRLASSMAAAYLAGALIWFVPLMMLTGGPAEYFRVLSNQGAEDFTGVVMLWTTPTPRQLLRALQAAFIAPWSFVWIASIVLLLAAIGLLRMLWRDRAAVAALAIAFGPYLAFDLVFQESVTTRYALPLVVPLSYAAVRGASMIRSRVLVVGLALLAGFNVFSGTLALSGYAAAEAPAFRLLNDMARSFRGKSEAPVLAMHRRDDFDLRRPIVWVIAVFPGRHSIAGPSKARVARAREVLERRRARAGLVCCRSPEKRSRARQDRAAARTVPVAFQPALCHGRHPSERDGLAHDRSSRLVSRRRMGHHAGIGGSRARRRTWTEPGRHSGLDPPRSGSCHARRGVGLSVSRWKLTVSH